MPPGAVPGLTKSVVGSANTPWGRAAPKWLRRVDDPRPAWKRGERTSLLLVLRATYRNHLPRGCRAWKSVVRRTRHQGVCAAALPYCKFLRGGSFGKIVFLGGASSCFAGARAGHTRRETGRCATGAEWQGRLGAYLERHPDTIADYDALREAGCLVGGGLTEKANEPVVAQRLKNGKMHWSREGANAVALLCARHLNQLAYPSLPK